MEKITTVNNKLQISKFASTESTESTSSNNSINQSNSTELESSNSETSSDNSKENNLTESESESESNINNSTNTSLSNSDEIINSRKINISSESEPRKNINKSKNTNSNTSLKASSKTSSDTHAGIRKKMKDYFSDDLKVNTEKSDDDNYDSDKNGYREIDDTISDYGVFFNKKSRKIDPIENSFQSTNKSISTGTTVSKDPSYNPNSAEQHGKLYKINL